VTSIEDRYVKVHFKMDLDDDGWPPVSVESLWAVDLCDGTVRLANTPWFVRGVASDDVIRVEFDDEGIRWARETVRASEHCTIRLIVPEGQRFNGRPAERPGDVSRHWEEGRVTAAWNSVALG
jgi:hypothetical protein